MFQHYLENLANLKFCHILFSGLENAWIGSKSVKGWNFNSNPRKKHEICKFNVPKVTFRDVIYKKIHLHLCHIYIINTNTVIQRQVDLGFQCFYLEITWKMQGMLCYQRSGNPVCTSTACPFSRFCLAYIKWWWWWWWWWWWQCQCQHDDDNDNDNDANDDADAACAVI